MSYLGRSVDAISNVEKLDNITFNGCTTYALTKSSAAFTPAGKNNILISISGVVQQGNFSVSGSNIVFDSAVAGTESCDFIMHYGTGLITTPADDTVSTASIQNDAVTVDKVNLISTSSVPSLEAKGTSGQTEGYIQLNCAENSHGIKLKSPPHSAGQSYTLTFPSTAPASNKIMQTDGSGNLSFVDAPSGGLVPIAQSQSTSATGAVNFDGCFTTTYKNYFVVISHFVPASANDVIMRFRDSSPATLTDSNYAYGGETTQNNNADEDFNYGDNQANFQITHGVNTDVNRMGATLAMHIFKPYDSATYTRFNATYGYVNSSGYLRSGSIGGAYQQNSSVRGVRFEMSSGNTDAHDVRIYGIVDS